MNNLFPKAFEHNDAEQKWYNVWLAHNIFDADSKSNKPPYSILMPPPNVTGILHFGHILNLTIQDLYIRSKRMQGYEVCWFPGTDHAGIATQSKVEAELRKEGISRYDLGRDKFIEKVWQWKNKYGNIILEQMRQLGISVDWNRVLFTMDDSASNAVKQAFIRLFEEGLIKKDFRIINWSPLSQTALSDEEVIYKEVPGHLYTLRYCYEEDTTKWLLLSTTRPETIFGDVAVAVNPNDSRYTALIGKRVRVPLTDRYIPIIADDYADPTFGTGCVKITPAHDPNDYEVSMRNLAKLGMESNLNFINFRTISKDAKLTGPLVNAEFIGLDRFDARKAILVKLQANQLVEKIDDYSHNVGYSERGGEQIEPYLSQQWFLTMKPFVSDALQAVKDGHIKFHPQHWVKTYEHWLTGIRDWCISRQLWWGHRIPVYYTEDGKFTAATNEDDARKKLNLPANASLTQDEDSLDTWFSSWLWPLTTMRWLVNGNENTPDMQKFLPTDLLVTAPDIIFFWVARMIIATQKFNNTIPFKDVYFTSTIRDGLGRKLSKSLGNSPDPLNIIAKYGADAVRFSMAFLAPLGQDVRMDVDVANQDIASMELGRNFANKVWNAGKFINMKQAENYATSNNDCTFTLSYADKWMLSKYNSTIQKITEYLNEYRVTEYAKLLYDFIWRDFCDWYVEILKVQLNQSTDNNYKQQLTKFATNIYENILKILHPLMPFITEELYHLIADRAENDSISTAVFPVPDGDAILPEIEEQFELVQSVVEEVRKLRASINVPSQKLPATISVPNENLLNTLNNVYSVIASLCKFSALNIAVNAEKPNGSTSTVFHQIAIHLSIADTIDIEQERNRLQKEIARLNGNIKSTEAKLNNEKFVSGASPEIVAKEREKLASMQESLTKVIENLNDINK
ncbi:MAG: valine--tRNA ligase [Ignavibacteria bacterium]|jgi:valyl-tRNA synthetase|nr:valine--tRNA ligase [Ignavibacteria bacterium]